MKQSICFLAQHMVGDQREYKTDRIAADFFSWDILRIRDRFQLGRDINSVRRFFLQAGSMEDSQPNKIIRKMEFYLIKLPFILILITFGFLMEFVIELPFMVMCTLERLFSQRNQSDPPVISPD